MFVKIVVREVDVAFHDVDDDRPPGLDVAGLGLIEQDEAADNIYAKSVTPQ